MAFKLLLLGLAFLPFGFADYCTRYYDYNHDTSAIVYCFYGCCDEYENRDPCCSLNAGAVAGIVIGTIVFIAIVVVAVAFGRRRYRQTTTVQYVGGHCHTPTVITTQTATAQQTAAYPQPAYPQPAYPQPPPYSTTSSQHVYK